MAKAELSGEFRPEQLSRRGEVVAWGLALVIAGAWLIVRIQGQRALPVVPLLFFFLLFSALSISLGNWMDRQTVLHLDAAGLEYTNGLRHTNMQWNEIHQVQVFPSRWGKKVRVIGERAYFAFRTLGEVSVQGEVKGQMGFAEGEMILAHILSSAQLKAVSRPGGVNDGGYYYARE